MHLDILPLNRWDGPEVYPGDGRVEIDNNQMENTIQPTAVGQNWLFLGDGEAGDRPLCVSAKGAGTDPGHPG